MESLNVKEKVNFLLNDGDFIERLGSNSTVEHIVKTFETEGVLISEEDAENLKKVILDSNEELDEKMLDNVTGGGLVTAFAIGVALGMGYESAKKLNDLWRKYK